MVESEKVHYFLKAMIESEKVNYFLKATFLSSPLDTILLKPTSFSKQEFIENMY